MNRKTTIRLTMTLECIEEATPSSGPFRTARRVIETSGETVAELVSPGVRKAAVAPVIPLKRVVNGR
jgi:hypothetical protein